LSKIMRK